MPNWLLENAGDSTIRVYWWGHACIEIVYGGERLMIDPHDGASIGVNVPPPPKGPRYVLVTHNHFDHNAVEVVKTSDTREVVVEKTGEFVLGPFKIRGVKLPHDEFGGRLRGHVVAYRIEVEGISLTHLSDIGDLPDEETLEKLKADIVFVPAGGVYTIHPDLAKKLIEALQPAIVVPIHYWLPGYFLPLDPIDTLLNNLRKLKMRVVRLETNWFEVTREALGGERKVYVLSPPRR